ncbi:uncharacterized protein LOC142750440 [Rhinoderma darwinii]|uniref:uncharacterized protein LOC142750440 n=1 Tax=Rhinoderma darwinii TaxID=43563 RepID=UPI003F67D9A8
MLQILKFKQYAHGDRGNKMMSALIRKHQGHTFISEIKTDKGQQVTDTKLIADAFQAFYQGLYNLNKKTGTGLEDDTDTELMNSFLNSVDLPTLEGYYLDEENQCVPSCPQGFFGDLFTQTCEKCSVTCESCAGSIENCLKCNTKDQNLFLHEGRCLFDCPEGYFENIKGSCETCEGSCWTCEGSKMNCLSCVDGLYLENNKCLPNCSLSYYPDEEGICKHCPAHCTVCADEKTCLECSYLYLLFNGTCKATCPDGYYEDLDAGRCISCHNSCETCSGTSDDDCETCPSANPKLYQGKCLTRCPSETFYNYALSECQECHRTCAKCSGPQPTDCTQCQSQLTLDQDSEMCGVQGDAKCPPQTFLEDDLFTCSTCDKTCESCDGPTAENCLTCSVPFYLYKNTCVKQCPSGTYNTSEEADGMKLGFCSACHQVCTTCHGGSAKDCDICAAGYYKLLHLCILHCPPGGKSCEGLYKFEQAHKECKFSLSHSLIDG